METITDGCWITMGWVKMISVNGDFDLSMAPPKNHAVGDILIVAKLESIWYICCILMENS